MRRTLLIVSFIFVILSALPLLAQSESRVWQDILYSDSLKTMKLFNVYLPAGYDESTEHYPVVYFLHPKGYNWVRPDIEENTTRTLKDIADSLIATGQIGKMILVVPDLGNCPAAIPGMPNMLRPDLTDMDGIGTGQFENYLKDDLIPYVDSRYRTMAEPERRGIDGFDLGGYAAILSSVKNPHLFSSVGSYDAPFMWPDLDDPMKSGNQDDSLWLSSQNDSTFGAVFDTPRNIEYMIQNNVSNLLKSADEATLEDIRAITFHIRASNQLDLDPYETSHSGGLLSRNMHFTYLLVSHNIINSSDKLVLQDGKHDWSSALLYASKSLVKHWQAFRETTTALSGGKIFPDKITLSQNYPNPFNPSTTIPFYLKQAALVKMDVFNALGQTVSTIANEFMAAGNHQLVFDATDLPSGIYYYRILAGSSAKIKKMMLVK